MLFGNCSKCSSLECYECISPLIPLNSSSCGYVNVTNSSSNIQYPCTDSRCAFCRQSALDLCLICKDNNLTIKNGVCAADCGDGLMYDT